MRMVSAAAARREQARNSRQSRRRQVRRRNKMTVDQKLANRKTTKKADRDGVYKRRGWWHFDYRDPETGKWRSRTTGKTNYNEAKTARAEFLEVLGKGRYSPSNDRLDFTVATEARSRSTDKFRYRPALNESNVNA